MARRGLRFTQQVSLLQAGIVVVVVLVGVLGSAALLQRELSDEVGRRALAVARTIAQDDDVRVEAERLSDAAADPALAGERTPVALAAGPVQRYAEAVRASTGALFVVVTDDRGIRLSHPDPANLGEVVSTDPSEALAGREVVSTETGTLGASARAKVPVLGADGTRVVGEVSVGIDADVPRELVVRALPLLGGLTALALLLGLLASFWLNRRLRRLTLGIEPEELRHLLQGHEAVLNGSVGGVVAVDPSGVVVLANDEASRLLGAPVPVGVAVADAGLPAQVARLLLEPEPEPRQTVVGKRALMASSRRVERDGRPLGSVLTLHGRTDVEQLTRQLDAVQAMSGVLRAHRHEAANRLHLLSGLLAGGRVDAAAEHLRALLGTDPSVAGPPGLEHLEDPYLQAFVAAKASHARELGVGLVLGEAWVRGELVAAVDVTTVLGNLIDNAMEAARTGPAGRRGPVVEVDLVEEGDALVVAVADSGAGVPPELVDVLFDEGVSGRRPTSETSPGGRGIGLALVRQVAARHGGRAWLADPGGSSAAGVPVTPGGLGGAVVVVRLPGVLRAPVDAPDGAPEDVPESGSGGAPRPDGAGEEAAEGVGEDGPDDEGVGRDGAAAGRSGGDGVRDGRG